MGLAPFLVASSLNLVLAQRLLRRVCPKCREPVTLHPEVIQELGITAEDVQGATIFRGRGCDNCNGTGHRGRIGVYEVMPISSALRRMILDRASTTQMREQAVKEGMVDLRNDALAKMKAGVTSAEEVLRETMAVL
jgi:type IV pilus assembly protein PilB